jgi:alpha-L-fucosidase
MSTFVPMHALPELPDETRTQRLAPFKEARFGMFITFGPYAVLGRGEWVMQQEHIPAEEYTALGNQLQPKPGAVREWARLAKRAGMRYMVLTTKHCDGFHLWGTQQSDFNAVKMGPGRDLVAEYVEACRAEGLLVGLYYCLMDWRHPDGDLCAVSEDSRRRFVDYTHASVRELMTQYGKVDILWFDGPWPMATAEQWESERLIAEVRKLQPHIVINNRARRAEDFSTPEGSVDPQSPGRAWEACMTMNGDWGYSETPSGDWRSVRDILRMMRTASAFGGNILLNIGPKGDGSVPAPSLERLEALGRWLELHGEAVYGAVERLDGTLEPWTNAGYWTLKGNTGYFWLLRGNSSPAFGISRVEGEVKRITVMHSGQELQFEQTPLHLRIYGVPPLDDEPSAQTPVLKVEFHKKPRQQIGAGMLVLPDDKGAWW